MTFLLSPAEAIIQFSQDAIISTSLEGAIMTWNRGASKLYGYNDTEILGRPIQQLFSASTVALLPEILEQVLHGQTVEQLETTHLHQDGQPIEIALTASPIRSLLYEGIAFIIRDVTSRKKDEWKIQQLIEDLNDLHRVDRELGYTLNIDRILSLAMDMVIRRSDATGATIAWIKESTQTLEPLKSLGKTTWLTEPLPLSAVLKRQDELGDAFRKTVLYIYPPRKDTHSDLFIPLFLRKQAQGVLILEQISPFSETDIGFLIQIAGRLALAIEKAWLFSHLSALEAIKSEMLQMASHDLRNPLAQIMGYADILASTLENNAGEQQQYLANIMRAATHMNELLEDILSLERIQQVATTIYEPVNVIQLTEDVVILLQPQARLKQQTLVLEIPQLTALISANPLHLRQALINLITNALKYTPPAGQITVKAWLDQNQEFHFAVQDTGYGIPANRQAKIFERFYRAHTPGTEAISGTGLGLSLVKMIIERYGGRVWFTSEEGKGSTFGFVLPLIAQPMPEKKSL